MRTGTIIGLAVTLIVAVAAVAGAVTARAYANRPVVESVSPAPGTVVSGETPIRIVLRSVDSAKDVRITIDGVDISTKAIRTQNGYELSMPDLADGSHTAIVELGSTDLLGERANYRWTFGTDRTAPQLSVDTVDAWSEQAKITGRSEPGASVTAQWQDGEVVTTADQTGTFLLVPLVNEGETAISVIAEDGAGNQTVVSHTLRVDASDPKLTTGGIEEWFRDTDHPTIYAFVNDASPTEITATINGAVTKATPISIGYVIETGRLPQGTSLLTISVKDSANHTTKQEFNLNVNSTEQLANDLTLTLGAQGRDVARLTRRLKLEGAWTGQPSWVYDDKVEAAVRVFQKKLGLPQDGVARPALLARTSGRIVIIKSKFVLNLYLDGKFVKQYKVAVGMSEYPTPSGSFVVTDLLKDPTWTPPNSPWAAGLEVAPPGSSNPLGTRWIGTTAPLIGIHGTPQDWTIGTSASHGCIRMHIPEVEELFEQVTAGMPVEIRD